MANEWDRTPWMIGGGAKHSVNVGRLLAYAAFAGDEGIIGTGDLKVTAAPVPNGTVKITPGACAILNRGLNINYESYAARLPITDTVAISATGSGSGRSDLVVAVVMDPFQTGSSWSTPDPEDIADGTAEFVKTLVIPGVANTTRTVKQLGLGYSAIALARIDIPPSTGTITNAMIVDLRQMASVRQKRVTKAQHVTIGTPASYITTSFAVYPPEAIMTVEVPEWANYAYMKGAAYGVYRNAGDLDADFIMDMRKNIGGPEVAQSGITNLNANSASEDRITIQVGGGRVAIPAAWRGGEVFVGMYGKRNNAVGLDAGNGVATSFDIEVTFTQEPGTSE